MRVAIVAALTLFVGFVVAVASDSRPLGGVVLVAGGALCAVWMWQTSGAWRTLAVLAVAFVLFVVSHPLGKVIGSWPAVIAVSLITGAVAYALVRPKP